MQTRGAVALNRIPPEGQPTDYQTYSMLTPRRSHWRRGSCEEVDCPNLRNGWVTTVDLSTELGQRQAHHIVKESGRSFRIEPETQHLFRFVFPAGQQCFTEHQVRNAKPARLLVSRGDWRVPAGYRRAHTREHVWVEDWVEDMAENQDRLAEAIKRG
jgi:hypothetical protein